jgi:hypothetical protein
LQFIAMLQSPAFIEREVCCMRIGIAATALILISLPAAAMAMNAQSFYARGMALKNMGPAAMVSPDLQPLLDEAKRSSKLVKAENDKAKLAGKPLFCGPAKNSMTAEELLAEFGRIPKPRRSKITVTQALREIAIRKYPCR